jgi:hypothetical protein
MPLWYYGSPAGQRGPVEENELRAMVAAGQVGPETLVWRDGMTDWSRLDTVAEFSQGRVSPYAPPQSLAPGYYMPVVNSGLAIASLVCGILAVVTCYFGGIMGVPAVICGHLAISKIQQSPIPMSGRGSAIAGLVMGYLGILFSLAALVIIFIAMVGSMN